MKHLLLFIVLQTGRGGADKDMYIDAMESENKGSGIFGILIFIGAIYLFFLLRAEYYKNKKI